MLENLLLGLYEFGRLGRGRGEDERRISIPKNSPRTGLPHFGAALAAFETNTVSELSIYVCRLTRYVLCFFL